MTRSKTLSASWLLVVLCLAAPGVGRAGAQAPVRVAPPEVAAGPATAPGQVPTPEQFFGFKMGADGQLADWETIRKYFQAVATTSDRVRLVDAGATTEGRRLVAAIVSAPENLRRLKDIQATNELLSDPRRIAGDEQLRAILRDQKVVVAIGCSIHASEIGATQAANELLYDLATTADPNVAAILRDVVLVLLPSLNPDGHTLVVDWYRQTKGTPYDGGPMPWAYHKYVDHDINRDMFMLNMEESRSLARFFSHEWHPQVFLAMHQMGQTGPRMFVPPNYDPIDPNQDPLIWREAGLLGSAMSLALEADNRSGVLSNAMYDYFWPGYEDSAPIGRNTVCLLTEVASAKLATPIDVAAKDLRGTPKGLAEYRPQINFPNPWPGGRWRLRDIVEYDLVAMRGLLSATAKYREDLLRNFYAMGRHGIERGKSEAPFAYIIPPDEFDPAAAAKLTNLLIQGGVEVQQAQEPLTVGTTVYQAGTAIVLMAQPFRAYAKSLLEVQSYPVRRSGPPSASDRPYDVAGWTLPYQMGVRVDKIDAPFEPSVLSRLDRVSVPPQFVMGHPRPSYYFVDTKGTAGAVAINRLLAAGLRPQWTMESLDLDGYRYPAGTVVLWPGKSTRPALERLARELGVRVYGVKGRPPVSTTLGPARTGLYRPWNAAIDEGWTRWLFEQYEFPFRTVRDADIRAGGLRGTYDVIVLPSIPAARLIEGNRPGSLPDQYVGGLGELGVAALRAFVEQGGTLVTLDASSEFAIDALKLPVRNVLKSLPPEQFFCPGSVLRLDVDVQQPLGFGLQERTSAFFAFGSAFEIGNPGSVRAVARYGSKDVLLSGWLEGEASIAGRPAVVEAKVGLGRAVLIGFRAQHRGQSYATFRLLFNAILSSGAGEVGRIAGDRR